MVIIKNRITCSLVLALLLVATCDVFSGAFPRSWVSYHILDYILLPGGLVGLYSVGVHEEAFEWIARAANLLFYFLFFYVVLKLFRNSGQTGLSDLGEKSPRP